MEAALLPPWAEEVEARLSFHQVPSALLFLRFEHDKRTKNRLHMDFAPHSDDDRDAEIERLPALGATRVDVGQSDEVTWDVLAGPEGNGFRVLPSRNSWSAYGEGDVVVGAGGFRGGGGLDGFGDLGDQFLQQGHA